MAGWVNVDLLPHVKPDVVCNLEKFPWPWETDSVAEIYSHHVFEHFDNVVGIMNECWRILEPGGFLECFVPFGPTFAQMQDPTHKRSWTDTTINFFLLGHDSNIYGCPGYELEFCRLLDNGPYGTPKGAWRPRLRNLIPFRQYMKFFLLGMYDEVHFKLRKPQKTG
jgi:SAM-dependent methyltransferase